MTTHDTAAQTETTPETTPELQPVAVVYEVDYDGDSLFFLKAPGSDQVRPLGLWAWTAFEGNGESVFEVAFTLIKETLQAAFPGCEVKQQCYEGDTDPDDNEDNVPTLLDSHGDLFEETDKAYDALCLLVAEHGEQAITRFPPGDRPEV